VFLELAKYEAGDAPETPVDGWAYFFRETKNLDVIPAALLEAPFREALEVARMTSFSPVEQTAYERAKMAEQDARGALAVARAEGRLEGELEARRATLVRLLTRVGIAPSGEELARIESCTDPVTLGRWIGNAISAKTVADVLA
jgi:hypothetical protein